MSLALSIAVVAFFLLFGFDTCESQSFNPCTNHNSIDNPYRSINYTISSSDNALCDSNLQTGWYRFISEVGGKIPETKPAPYHCGTVAPMYITTGTHPKTINQENSVTVCANVFGQDKACKSISIKNCGSYFVYELRPTYGCSMAYCAGDKIACPNGMMGTPPNCINKIYANVSENLLPKPRVLARKHDEESIFTMICKFDFDLTRTWTNISFAVEWFADNKLIKKETVCSRVNFNYPKCVERESDLYQDKINAGQMIDCRIRIRYSTHPDNRFTKWKNSNPYFVGLELSKKHEFLTECGTSVTINIKPTVPILDNFFPRFRLARISSTDRAFIRDTCSYDLTDQNFKDGINLTISSVCNDVAGASSSVEYWLEQQHIPPQGYFWYLGYKTPFRVSVTNTDLKKCRTHNDPHVDLFDQWQRNTILETGIYVLYKNRKRNIEIQTSHWLCSYYGVCNCGIAIKEGNDIIVFTICNENLENIKQNPSILHIKLNSCCRLSKAITIKERYLGASNLYRVVLPSGTRLTIARQYCYLDIDLLAPITSADNAEGLCGNANGVTGDDFNIGGDGVNYNGDIAGFTRSWKVDENDAGNLFKPKKTPCVRPAPGNRWCYCAEANSAGHDPDCKDNTNDDRIHEITNSMESIRPHILVESKTCKLPRKRRSIDEVDDIYYNDDITLNNEYASFFVNEEDEHGEKSNSFANKRVKRSAIVDVMSKENATRHCKQVIEESSAGKMCKDVSQSDIDSIMKSCINDLKITGDLQFAQSAFGVMKESCERTIFRNLSLYKNDSSGELVPPLNLVEDLCPNDCSNHGNCTNRTCICDKGYTSKDCSSEINAIPKLMGIYNGGLCDVRERPCKKTDLLGKYFIRSENLTCHVLEHKVFPSRWQPNPQWLKLSGYMFDLFGVRCDLPDPPTNLTNFDSEGTPASGLWITISNDKERKSQKQMRFISYDSVCMSCNKTGNCTKKENTCLINGHCFSPNQWNPQDWCQLCIPDNSTDTWTKRKDNKAPSFEAGQGRQYAIAGEELPLQLKASDPDYRPVKFSMISTTASTAYTLSSNGLLQWNVTSQAEFTVKVTDECNATDTNTITLNLVKCLCQNGGRCYPHSYYPRGSGKYSCQCPTGFNGTKCETNIDDCLSVDCGNGTCIDGVNNYTCRCHAGFMGSLCNQRIFKCTNKTCFTGVACNETVSGITCGSCPDGLLGDGKTCLAPTTAPLSTTAETQETATPTEETTQHKVTESPTTDEITEEYTVELRVLKEWDDAYLDKASQQFRILAETLKNEIDKLYRTAENHILKKTTVISVRKGSIIVEFQLVFTNKANDPLKLLKKDVKDGVLGPYKVDPKSLKVKGERTNPTNATEKTTDLLLILILVGLATLVIIVVIAVILVRKCVRAHYQVENTKESIEMEKHSVAPIPNKAHDDDAGHTNASYQSY